MLFSVYVALGNQHKIKNMLNLKVEINAKNFDDLIDSAEDVVQGIREGYKSGNGWDVVGEPEKQTVEN